MPILGLIAVAALAGAVISQKSPFDEWAYEAGIRRASKLMNRLIIERPGLLEDIGKIPDVEVAKKYGISRERVRQYRSSLSFQERYEKMRKD